MLLLSGGSGVGRSTTLDVLCQEMGIRAIEWSEVNFSSDYSFERTVTSSKVLELSAVACLANLPTVFGAQRVCQDHPILSPNCGRRGCGCTADPPAQRYSFDSRSADAGQRSRTHQLAISRREHGLPCRDTGSVLRNQSLPGSRQWGVAGDRAKLPSRHREENHEHSATHSRCALQNC